MNSSAMGYLLTIGDVTNQVGLDICSGRLAPGQQKIIPYGNSHITIVLFQPGTPWFPGTVIENDKLSIVAKHLNTIAGFKLSLAPEEHHFEYFINNERSDHNNGHQPPLKANRFEKEAIITGNTARHGQNGINNIGSITQKCKNMLCEFFHIQCFTLQKYEYLLK